MAAKTVADKKQGGGTQEVAMENQGWAQQATGGQEVIDITASKDGRH